MMNDERYVRKGYKIWDTYSDREVQELNYRSQSDYMCEVLNEKESRINTLVKENEQLKFENKTLKSNYQREIQSSIDFCNAYSKTNGELLEEIEKLVEENEQLRKELKNRSAFIVDKGLGDTFIRWKNE